MPRGYLAFILHAHLPYVRHPEHDEFLEERWLFEAITETYLPLAQLFSRLGQEQTACRITMSFTPTLLEMLGDPLLQARYVRHLDRLIELTQKEMQRTRWLRPFNRLSLFYRDRLTLARALYVDEYQRDLIGAFKRLMQAGIVEPMASCATHGYLPLMDSQPATVRAQVRLGVQAFEQAFGLRPQGMWLPECGYHPGHDEFLAEEGIRYFIVDAHGLLFGSPRPKGGVFAPVRCPSKVAAFARDLASSNSVWSATQGYPGDPEYREFYRDIAHELEYDYIRPYINADGSRADTGIKYYRITGAEQKEPYHPERASAKANEHAQAFLADRKAQVGMVRELLEHPPIIVCPFDAELFGHWWFEGPEWLEHVIRGAAEAPEEVALTTPGEYLARHQELQTQQPAMSSWGSQGYHDVWLNGANDWVWRQLHAMADRMTRWANAYPNAEPLKQRALNQMARELLLAQASDWPFILKTKTHITYAYRRLEDHMARFSRLDESLQQDRIDEPWLAQVEATDRLFPQLDYRVFATPAD